MLKRLISKVSSKKNLTIAEAYQALNLFTLKETSEAQIAALLTALKMKGENVDELTGFACAMKEKALKIDYTENAVYDCCGTGGDMASTINVSTSAAILAASCGVYIAKHSNRAVTGTSGSTDVLQELKIPLCNNPYEVINCLREVNISFLFAPAFHQATSNVAKIRKELGIRTIFNLLGPLTNPIIPDGQLIGVSSPELCLIIAETLKNLKMKRAMIVCATMPRLDELSICGPTIIYELNNDHIKNYEITPEQLGLKRASIEDIKGIDPKTNATIITKIFENEIQDARKDIILLNTAAILWVANKADSLQEALTIADSNLSNGKAYEKLLTIQSPELLEKLTNHLN